MSVVRYIYILSGLYILTSFTALFGQSSLSGMVADTSANRKLENVSIVLIKPMDSILVKFTRSKLDGHFEIHNIPSGKYIYIVTHPAYADFADSITLLDGESKNLGMLAMYSKEILLKGVIVRDRVAAIVVKGDTVEFKADSFATREGASVEDLLKKLPGMQVDRNGNIQAFGKAVEQVLVDGEEFFGNDPTMATQNLKAESVDKVQVFDKKSDQATFTGVDDGESKRTINIQLKEEAKKGYFGKIAAGSDFNKYYDGQTMANLFKKKMKVAAYAIANNYKYYGLGWDDQQKYAGKEYNYNEEDGNFFSYWEGDNDDIGEKGFPNNFEAGAHFSNKWKDNKHQLSLNYNLEQQYTKYSESNFNRYLFPDSTFTESEYSNKSQNKLKNSLNFKYEFRIDSLSSLRITGNMNQRGKESKSGTFSQSIANTMDTVNSINRNIANQSDKENGDYSVLYKKKFKRVGRTFVMNLNQTMVSESIDGTLGSENKLYTANAPTKTDQVQQDKVNRYSSNKISTSATYTEPINKKVLIEGQYAFTYSDEISSRLSYNTHGGTRKLDSVFSNSFNYGLTTNRGGAFLKLNHKKIVLKAGASINNAKFHTINQFTNLTKEYSFNNIFPQVNFEYKFSKQKGFTFNYGGSTKPPSLGQLQPLRDNTNPFNIGIGNPNLKQEFSHNFSTSFHSYKVLSGSWLWCTLSFSSTHNDIVTSVNVDEFGRQNYQFVNVNGNYNGYGYLSYHFAVKKNHKISLGTNFNTTKSKNFLKGALNENLYSKIGSSIGYGFEKEKKPEFNITYQPNFNMSSSSLNTSGKISYWTHNIEGDLYWPLPRKFEFNTDFEYTHRQKIALSNLNNNFFIWNASISKKVFKDKSGKISLRVNDILKQRLGFMRSAYGNIVSEDYYTLITRYWLLNFVWNFSDKATKASKTDDDDDDE